MTAFNNLKIFVRACSTTKYWQFSTIWRLTQSLFYFYQILTALNNLQILSELVLLLPNTNRLQQYEDFVRACSTSTKYWPPSIIWRFLSDLVLLLPNTDSFELFEDFVRVCSTSTKYWPPSTIRRFLSELVLLLLNTDRLQQF